LRKRIVRSDRGNAGGERSETEGKDDSRDEAAGGAAQSYVLGLLLACGSREGLQGQLHAGSWCKVHRLTEQLSQRGPKWLPSHKYQLVVQADHSWLLSGTQC